MKREWVSKCCGAKYRIASNKRGERWYVCDCCGAICLVVPKGASGG